MLMFAKTSFVYYMVDVFVFPNDDVKHIFSKLDIIKCYLCLTSTDTDSASLQFIFNCKVGSSIIEDKAKWLIFEVLIKLKIKKLLDIFENYWDNFNAQTKSLKKGVRLYEIDYINNQNVITIAVNLNP